MDESAPDPRRTFVFAYGSNLDPARMTYRAPSVRFVGRARLGGFELHFHKRGSDDGTGKANAFHTGDTGAEVHGVVYELDEAELADLDAHEAGYERRLLRFSVVAPVQVETVQAWVYLALAEVIDDTLVPTRWYLDHVLAGVRAHGLPAALAEHLERLPTDG